MRARPRQRCDIKLEAWVIHPDEDYSDTFVRLADRSFWRGNIPTISIDLSEEGMENPNTIPVVIHGEGEQDAAIYGGGARGIINFEDGTQFRMTYAWNSVTSFCVHAEPVEFVARNASTIESTSNRQVVGSLRAWCHQINQGTSFVKPQTSPQKQQ